MHLGGVDARDLDETPSLVLRDRHHGAGAPSDHQAVDEPANPVALVGGAGPVLVRHDRPGRPVGHQRGPEVGAELVRVDDVDPLVANPPSQPVEPAQPEPAPALEGKEAHAELAKALAGRRALAWIGRPRHAKGRLKALPVQALGDLPRQRLTPADEPEAVDQRHHSYARVLATHGPHLLRSAAP